MRAFFFRRNWRERVLLLAVLLVGTVIWLSSALGRLRELRGSLQVADGDLENQGLWLRQQSDIDARLKASIEQVRSGRSLTQAQFNQQWNALVNKHGLTARFDPASTDRKPPVAIHTVNTRLDKAELEKFLSLIDDLAVQLPLVNIDKLSIVPDRDPRQLQIDIKLSALELLK